MHHLTPPCRQISKPDSGYIYTSCSRTYPAHLKHVSRISATYLNGCAKQDTHLILVSHMYPACILHVSYRLCQDTHLSLVSCMSCMYPHVSDMLREDTFFEHVSCMYPACIPYVSDTLSQDTSRYIRIHQDTSRYIRIQCREKNPPLWRENPTTPPRTSAVLARGFSPLGPNIPASCPLPEHFHLADCCRALLVSSCAGAVTTR